MLNSAILKVETPMLNAGFFNSSPIQTNLWPILCQNSQIFVTLATRVGLFKVQWGH